MVDAQISIIPDKSLLEREIRDSLSKTYKLTGLNAGSITKPLGEIRGQLGEFEKSLEASNARVVAFGASAGSIYLLSDAIKGLVKSTIDVEKTLADINVILDESDANIKAFGNSLFNVANQTSQTFETAAGAALEFSRQGLGLEETAKRTADALTLAKISGLSAADSVEALTAAVNSFADSGLTTAQIVNKLAAVDAKYAVSSADLAEAIKRVGSSALDAGVNIDQLIGLVTSAQQTTARGGAVIGNSFKTIFTRLQRPKVLDELKEVGITTQTISGQTLPLIQILTQLASTYDSLSSSQKSQVAELVGGVYQINILKAVLGDLSKEYSVYSGALRESSTATNEAEKRVGSLTQTLSSQLNKVSNNLKRAGSVVGELTIAPALQNILSGANAVLEQFALGKEPEDTGDKVAQGVLKGIGKGLAGPGLVIAAAGFFQLFKRLVLFISDASKTLLGLGAAAQKQLAIQTQVLQLLQQNPTLYKAITSGAISSADAATLYLNAVKATNVELERQRVISAQIAASVPKGVVPPTVAAPVPAAPAPRTTPRMRRRASGFIPSFADSGAMAEVQGASQHKGGYKAGTPYITTIHDGKGGSFKSWVNSAETVTNFTNAAGYKATMVRPPNGFGPGTEIAAAGFIPNFANLRISRKELGNLLKTKQFQSITYKKSDGSVARYDAAQHRVRRDKLVGASAPAGHKNWTEYDNATGTIVLHTSKQGESEAKFRRFSIDGIQQLRSGGNTYDVYASGFIPNFAKKDKYKFPSISSAKMESNIARNFEKLSPENQKYFARAYEDYNNLIKVFSKASGTSPEKFANVMSALSPANPLERNALDALRYNLFAKKKLSTIASPIFLDEREIGSVKAQTYGANRTKAARLIVGLEKLTGNKRKAFLNNMLDPFGSPDVTVDYRAQGDALNKKFNVKNAPTMNREQYDKVSQAFRNVGAKAGVSGLGVQAATWIGGRMNSKAARGQDLNRGILKFFYDNPDKISLENLEFLLNVPAKGKARADFFKKASAMGVSKLGADSLISISRAGGYIPNFAGLSDAVNREKMMTGLPASQIMAHFDESGNPIAVTNKKDEPNGLKDITNSKGHVPNFAKKRIRYPKKTESVDPFASYKSLLKRTNPIAGENVPAPMYSEVAKGQEILAGEDAKKAAKIERERLAQEQKNLRNIQKRERAKSREEARLRRNAKARERRAQAKKVEAKAQKSREFFASQKIEREMLKSRKLGIAESRIQASSYQKTFLAQKASELQPTRGPSGGLRLLPSGIFPAPKFTGKEPYSKSELGILPRGQGVFRGAQTFIPEVKPTPSRLRLQGNAPEKIKPTLRLSNFRQPSSSIYNPELVALAQENEARNELRRQQEAAGAKSREAEAGRKAQRAAYAASLQRPKRMGVIRQARLIENLETSQRSRLLPSGPTVSSAGMERAQRKLQERRAREEARDIRRQANAQQTARTQAGMRLASYYGKGVQPAGAAPTATPAGAIPSTGGGGGRGPRLPVTPPAGGPPGGGPPNNPPNNGGGTSSTAQERYRRRFGDRAFFKRFGGGQPGGMKSFVGTLGLALTFQNAPEILNALGVSGIYADEQQKELTAKGQRIQTFGNVGAMTSMYASPAVTNALGQLPGKLIPQTIKKPFGGITKMGETLNRIPGMSKLGNLGKKLPGLGTALTLGMGAYSGVQARESGASLSESIMIGLIPAITSLLGSSLGAAAGTFAGGPVGTVAGGVGGFALGEKLGNKIVKSAIGEQRLTQLQENQKRTIKFQEESRMYSGSKAATMGLAAEKIRTFDIQKESSESEAEYTRKIKQSSDEYLKLRKDQAAQIIQDIGGINYASKLLSDSGNNIDAFRKQIAKTYMTTGQKEKGGFFTDTRSEEATKRATEQTKLIVKTLKEVEERKAVAPLMRDIGKSLDLFAAKARFISSVVQGFREKDFARGQNLLKNVGGGVEGFLNPEKVGTSFDAIVSSLKVLNDPRLARNSIERGRAAFNLMEGAGQMGIDFTDADRKRLSAMITKGFETQVGQIDIGLSRLGGQFFNDFGLRRGVAQSQFVSGVYQQRNRINTAEAALTGDYRMSMAGYVNPLEAKYGMANDAFIKGIEDTNKAFDLVSRQINTLGEAAQAGAISVKEFASFAEQIRGLTTTANPDNNQEIIAKLNDLIGSLNTRSQQILSQADLNRKTEVSGTVEIKFSENAEGWLQAAKNYSDLTQKDNKLKAGTNSNGTATPTSS